jgi:hypothetical protein
MTGRGRDDHCFVIARESTLYSGTTEAIQNSKQIFEQGFYIGA